MKGRRIEKGASKERRRTSEQYHIPCEDLSGGYFESFLFVPMHEAYSRYETFPHMPHLAGQFIDDKLYQQ